jgi:chromatin remodeling complex protein RSC6
MSTATSLLEKKKAASKKAVPKKDEPTPSSDTKPEKVEAKPKDEEVKKEASKKKAPAKKEEKKKEEIEVTEENGIEPEKKEEKVEEKKEKKKRKETTPIDKKQAATNANQDLEDIKKLVDDHKNNKDKEVQKILKDISKKADSAKKNVGALTKKKGTGTTGKSSVSGFRLNKTITKELADFLGIEETAQISRLDATRAICVYVHRNSDEPREHMNKWAYLNKDGRNLQDPNNKKNIIPDKALSTLLRYEQYKKDVAAGKILSSKANKKKAGQKVTDPALKYSTVQVLISQHFLKPGNDKPEE